MSTQKDIIQAFMQSLNNHNYTATMETKTEDGRPKISYVTDEAAKNALDDAIKSCSRYKTMQEAIDSFIEACKSATGNNDDERINNFLETCGITLDNTDTGALIGSDVSGNSNDTKSANNIVPEYANLYVAKTSAGQTIETGTHGWHVKATAAADHIISSGDDYIDAGAGDDYIKVNTNTATIVTGANDDTIEVGDGVSTITVTDRDTAKLKIINSSKQDVSSNITILDGSTSFNLITPEEGGNSTTNDNAVTNPNVEGNVAANVEATGDGYVEPQDPVTPAPTRRRLNAPRTSNLTLYSGGNIKVNLDDAITPSNPQYVGYFIKSGDDGDKTTFSANGAADYVGTVESYFPSKGLMKFTKNGLTLNVYGYNYDNDSDLDSDVTPFTSYTKLTADEKALVAGLYKWWIQEAVQINDTSYNLSFKTEGATVNEMDLILHKDSNSNTLAYVSTIPSSDLHHATRLILSVNMAKYANLANLSGQNMVDGTVKSSALDRTLAHEFTHAIMSTNINYFSGLPMFIKEGMAELTHGIDDNRPDRMKELIQQTVKTGNDWLSKFVKLSLTNSSQVNDSLLSLSDMKAADKHLNGQTEDTLKAIRGEYPYAAGYLFLHWLAKVSSGDTLPLGDLSANVNLNTDNATYYISGTKNTTEDANTTNSTGVAVGKAEAGHYTLQGVKQKIIYDGSKDWTISGVNKNDTVEVDDASKSGKVAISGTGEGVFIKAGGGADSIAASGIKMTVNAGSGDDTIDGRGGQNTNGVIDGGLGNNIITFFGSNTTIRAGSDYAQGQGSTIDAVGDSGLKNMVIQATGNDSIKFSGNYMSIIGSGGNNTIKTAYSNYAHNVVSLSGGDNYVDLYTSQDSIFTGAGNDTIMLRGSSGKNSTIIGGTGSDYIVLFGSGHIVDATADNKSDSFQISGENISVAASTGNDVFYIKSGSDNTIVGGGGNDEFHIYEGPSAAVITDFANDDEFWFWNPTITTDNPFNASGDGKGNVLLRSPDNNVNLTLNLKDNNKSFTDIANTKIYYGPHPSETAGNTSFYVSTLGEFLNFAPYVGMAAIDLSKATTNGIFQVAFDASDMESVPVAQFNAADKWKRQVGVVDYANKTYVAGADVEGVNVGAQSIVMSDGWAVVVASGAADTFSFNVADSATATINGIEGQDVFVFDEAIVGGLTWNAEGKLLSGSKITIALPDVSDITTLNNLVIKNGDKDTTLQQLMALTDENVVKLDWSTLKDNDELYFAIDRLDETGSVNIAKDVYCYKVKPDSGNFVKMTYNDNKVTLANVGNVGDTFKGTINLDLNGAPSINAVDLGRNHAYHVNIENAGNVSELSNFLDGDVFTGVTSGTSIDGDNKWSLNIGEGTFRLLGNSGKPAVCDGNINVKANKSIYLADSITAVDSPYATLQSGGTNNVIISGGKLTQIVTLNDSLILTDVDGKVYTYTSASDTLFAIEKKVGTGDNVVIYKTTTEKTNTALNNVNDYKLYSGTVVLTSGSSVTPTGSDADSDLNTIEVTDGDGLTVTVSGTGIMLGSLNEGDKFKIGDYVYEVTAVGFSRTTGDGNNSTVATWATAINDNINISALTNDNWLMNLPVEVNGTEATIKLGGINGSGIFVDGGTIYATLTKTNDIYTLTKNGTGTLTDIDLTGFTNQLTIDKAFANTAIKTSTFTISSITNDLIIKDGSISGSNTITITDGEMKIGDNAIKYTAGGDVKDGVNVEVENDVVVSITDLEVGEVVTFNGYTYRNDNVTLIRSTGAADAFDETCTTSDWSNIIASSNTWQTTYGKWIQGTDNSTWTYKDGTAKFTVTFGAAVSKADLKSVNVDTIVDLANTNVKTITSVMTDAVFKQGSTIVIGLKSGDTYTAAASGESPTPAVVTGSGFIFDTNKITTEDYTISSVALNNTAASYTISVDIDSKTITAEGFTFNDSILTADNKAYFVNSSGGTFTLTYDGWSSADNKHWTYKPDGATDNLFTATFSDNTTAYGANAAVQISEPPVAGAVNAGSDLDITVSGSNVLSLHTKGATINDGVNVVTINGNDGVTINFEGGEVSGFGALTNGETIKIGERTYTYDDGKFTSDESNMTWNGDVITAETGTIMLDSLIRSWSKTKTVTNSAITIDISDTNVIFVDSKNGEIATLTEKDGTYTLTKKADGITSIDITALSGKKFVVDFAADITATGTTTINGKTYTAASGNLTVKSDGTSSTLNEGTVTLDGNNNSVNATTDGTIVLNGNNSATVKVVDGKINELSGEVKITPNAGSITVNGVTYASTGELIIKGTIDGESKSLTLTNGTVTLTSGSSVTPTGSDADSDLNTIEVTGGDGITVTVSGTNITLGSLNEGDKFKIGEVVYEVTAVGFSRTTGDGNNSTTATWATAINDSINISALTNDNWQANLSVEVVNGTEATIKLGGINGSGVFVNGGTVYATLTKTNDTYTLTKNGTGTLTGIDLSGFTSRLTIDKAFANTTIKTSTFTISSITNDLLIKDGSISGSNTITITDGEMKIGDNAIKYTAGGDVKDGVNVEVENGVVVSITDLEVGETVTFNGYTYRNDNGTLIRSTGAENAFDETCTTSGWSNIIASSNKWQTTYGKWIKGADNTTWTYKDGTDKFTVTFGSAVSKADLNSVNVDTIVDLANTNVKTITSVMTDTVFKQGSTIVIGLKSGDTYTAAASGESPTPAVVTGSGFIFDTNKITTEDYTISSVVLNNTAASYTLSVDIDNKTITATGFTFNDSILTTSDKAYFVNSSGGTFILMYNGWSSADNKVWTYNNEKAAPLLTATFSNTTTAYEANAAVQISGPPDAGAVNDGSDLDITVSGSNVVSINTKGAAINDGTNAVTINGTDDVTINFEGGKISSFSKLTDGDEITIDDYTYKFVTNNGNLTCVKYKDNTAGASETWNGDLTTGSLTLETLKNSWSTTQTIADGTITIDDQYNKVTYKTADDVTCAALDNGTLSYKAPGINKIILDNTSDAIKVSGFGEVEINIVTNDKTIAFVVNDADFTVTGTTIMDADNIKYYQPLSPTLTIPTEPTIEGLTLNNSTIGSFVYGTDSANITLKVSDNDYTLTKTGSPTIETINAAVLNAKSLTVDFDGTVTTLTVSGGDGVSVITDLTGITSISGLDNNETVTINRTVGETSTTTKYAMSSGGVLISEGKIYDGTLAATDNILSLTGSWIDSYIKVSGAVDLSGVTNKTLLGTGEQTDVDKYVAIVSVSGSTYTIDKYAAAIASLTVKTGATGTYTLGDKTISISAGDGVTIAVTNDKVTSISGFDKDESVVIGGVTYTYDGSKISRSTDNKTYSGNNLLTASSTEEGWQAPYVPPTPQPQPAQPSTPSTPSTPADTTPADTTPADTTPADTTPADTTPADTTPADTTPADTTPADTTPADSTPADTTPADTTPADTTAGGESDADSDKDTLPADDTTPSDTVSTDTVPSGEPSPNANSGKDTINSGDDNPVTIIGGNDTTPADTTPADTTPADTTPADTTPADTIPADTTPADTTPADTTPADTTPADTTPADTTPADTTPADTTPADTTPADTTPGGDDEPAVTLDGGNDTVPADVTIPADDTLTPEPTVPSDINDETIKAAIVSHTDMFETVEAETTISDSGAVEVVAIDGNIKTTLPSSSGSSGSTDSSGTRSGAGSSSSNNVVTADFSSTTGVKDVTTSTGDQVVVFNDEGGNVARIENSAGNKTVVAGSGGDVIINSNTSSSSTVNIIGGAGDDTIIASGGKNEHIDLSAGGVDIIVATSGAKVTNYDASTNAGFLLNNIDNVMAAIVDDEIILSDNAITYNESANIEFGTSSETDTKDYSVANIYNSNNEMTKVAWTNSEGGVLNMTDSADDMLLVGNKDGTKAPTTIISGLGDNTIIAGSGDNVQLSGGKDLVELMGEPTTPQRQGATIDMSAGVTDGQATVTGFSDGFANNADKVKINSNDIFSFDFVGRALRLIFDKISLLFGLSSERGHATEEPESNVKNLLVETEDGQSTRHTFIDNNGVLNINDRYEKSMVYHGLEGSAIDYSNFDEKLYVNLAEGGGESDRYVNINKVTGGRGVTTLIGNDGANTLAAGKGNGSIYGAAGRDVLIGYSGDDKAGATTFYEVSGSGLDTVSGFEFGTSATSDKIHTFGEGIANYELVGDELRIQVGADYDDQMIIEGAANEVLQINAWNNDYVVEVGDNFKYDDAVQFYLNKSGSATIRADGAEDVAIMMNGWDGKAYDNVKVIDASGVTGRASLVGADGVNNIIIGGSFKNSLWGGSYTDDNAGDDLLIGGVKNEFFYGLGNGRDTIEGAANGDIINLFDISLEDISGTEVTNSGMNLKFNDGGSLQVNSNANLTFKLTDRTMSKEQLLMRNS